MGGEISPSVEQRIIGGDRRSSNELTAEELIQFSRSQTLQLIDRSIGFLISLSINGRGWIRRRDRGQGGRRFRWRGEGERQRSMQAPDTSPGFNKGHRGSQGSESHPNSGHQQHDSRQNHQVAGQGSQRRRSRRPVPGLDALGFHFQLEVRPVPFTDEGCQLEVLPPAPARLKELEQGEEQQGLKREPCEGQVEQEEKGWPQEGEESTPIKGESFPAKDSGVKVGEAEEALGDRSDVASSSSGVVGAVSARGASLSAVAHEASLMLGSGVILGPLALATTAFGTPVVFNAINLLGVRLTILGGCPLASSSSGRGIAIARVARVAGVARVAARGATIGAILLVVASSTTATLIVVSTRIVVSSVVVVVVVSGARVGIVSAIGRIVASGPKLLIKLSHSGIELVDSVQQGVFRRRSLDSSTPLLGVSEFTEQLAAFIQQVAKVDPVGHGGDHSGRLASRLFEELIDLGPTAHEFNLEVHDRGRGENIDDGQEMEAWKLLILLELDEDCLSRVTVGANIFPFELGEGKGLELFNQELGALEGVTLHFSHNHHPQDRATGTEGQLGTEGSLQLVIKGVGQPEGGFTQGSFLESVKGTIGNHLGHVVGHFLFGESGVEGEQFHGTGAIRLGSSHVEDSVHSARLHVGESFISKGSKGEIRISPFELGCKAFSALNIASDLSLGFKIPEAQWSRRTQESRSIKGFIGRATNPSSSAKPATEHGSSRWLRSSG